MIGDVGEAMAQRITDRQRERYERTGKLALLSADTYRLLDSAGVDLRYARCLAGGFPHQPGAMP